jgi:hypothetical protein
MMKQKEVDLPIKISEKKEADLLLVIRILILFFNKKYII